MKRILKSKSIYFLTLLFLVFSSCIKEPVNPNNNNGTSDLTDTTMLNVSYGSHIRQVYDIYLPANRDTSTPVILMIHGGAWKTGQKEDFNYYVNLIKGH